VCSLFRALIFGSVMCLSVPARSHAETSSDVNEVKRRAIRAVYLSRTTFAKSAQIEHEPDLVPVESPEPGTMMLFGSGLLILGFWGRKKGDRV
jgi:hypothetical protein